MRLRTLLGAFAIIGAALSGGSASAQTNAIPPERTFVDANNINLITGDVFYEEPGISIGPVDGGLEFHRTWIAEIVFGTVPIAQWWPKYRASVYWSPSIGTHTVTIDNKSYPFTLSGGVYTPKEPGTRLTTTSTSFTFTQRDGTIHQFSKWTWTEPSGTGYSSTPLYIIRPSGVVETYNHTMAYVGSRPNYTLRSITNSLGYQLHFTYGTGTTQVTAINNAIDYCAPTATTCTGLTQAWPQMTINGIQSAGTPMTDALGNVTTYSFVSLRSDYNPNFPIPHMSAINEPSGAVTQFSYARISPYPPTAPYAVSQVTRGSASWSYAYTPANPMNPYTAPIVVNATDIDGAARSVTVNPITALPYSDTQDGVGYAYAYNASYDLTSITVTNGVKAQFTRDARGNITQTNIISKGNGANGPDLISSASYVATCVNYLTCNQPNSTTDALGRTTYYTYHANSGGLLSVTSPTDVNGVSPQTRNTFALHYAWYKNSAGTIVQAPTPVWRLTQSSTCASGTAPGCVGTPNETRTIIGYGATGIANNLLPVTSTVQAGDASLVATTASAFDAIGNRISIDGPLAGAGDTVRTRYDLLRRVVGTISPDPDGAGPLKYRATRTTWNDSSQPTLIERGTVNGLTDPDWAAFVPLTAEAYGYDTLSGRLLTQTTSAGGTAYALSQFSYDSTGRLDCTAVRMNPAIYGSLPASACTLGTQGSYGPDRITRNGWSGARNVLIQAAYGTAAQADEQTSTYTSTGQLATVKDEENNLTTYEYDGYDRLVRTRFPVGTKGANSSSATDYEQLTLNAVGNVTQRRLRDGSVIGYTYDNLDRLTFKDRNNLAWGETDLLYAYDLMGRTVTSSDTSGHIITNTWDALGRRTAETSNWYGAMTSAWDLAGRRTRLTWPDGFYVTYDHDLANQMTAIRENGAASGVGVLATFAYDDLGRRTGVTRGNGSTTAYGYDAVSRLTSFTQNLAGSTYDLTVNGMTYNPASQRLGQVRSNDLYAWTGAANLNNAYTANGLDQYTAAGPVSPTYDGRGNLSALGPTSYSYTQDNQLAFGAGVGFSYDPTGRLYFRTSVNTVSQYDGSDPVMERDGSTNAILRRFVFGPGTDEPIVWYEGSGTSNRRWLHGDERGSIIAVTDVAANVLTIGSYDEYGNPAWTNPGNTPRFGYTGQQWLPDLGMSSYKARIYAPTLGRFMQTDPIGYGDGLNMYAYVGNDPINASDPTGMWGCDERNRTSSYWDQNGTACLDDVEVVGRRKSPFYVFPDVRIRLVSFQAAPALRGDPYHPDSVAARIRPPYSPNPAHDPYSSSFNPNKSPEPADAQAVYATAQRVGMGTWIGRSASGQIYQFFSDNAGTVHFAGIISAADAIRRGFRG